MKIFQYYSSSFFIAWILPCSWFKLCSGDAKVFFLVFHLLWKCSCLCKHSLLLVVAICKGENWGLCCNLDCSLQTVCAAKTTSVWGREWCESAVYRHCSISSTDGKLGAALALQKAKGSQKKSWTYFLSVFIVWRWAVFWTNLAYHLVRTQSSFVLVWGPAGVGEGLCHGICFCSVLEIL